MGNKPKPCIHYGKDGLPDAVADSVHELAQILGKNPSDVFNSLRRGYKTYAWIKEDDEDNE